MSNVLATGTRVTVTYLGKATQGIVAQSSTAEAATIELFGVRRAAHITQLPWSKVTKNEYRTFTARELDGQVVITETGVTNSHPINWGSQTTREGAWEFARARGMETVHVALDGTRTELGKPFDPRAFERAAYSGYVSAGIAATDGHYAPESLVVWVKSLRQHPEHMLTHDNHASEGVKAALPLYQQALAAIGL